MPWSCAKKTFDFKQPQILIMGILNVTPDSFSDGGKFDRVEVTVEHSLQMLEQGADIIDVGGESTRPGAAAVSAGEELDRVLPVIGALLKARPACCISIDTQKAEVAREAIAAGASILNDVNGLNDPGMIPLLAQCDVGCVIMHKRGTPQTMQQNTHYDNVIDEVKEYLLSRANAAQAAGVAKNRICLDPGIGFGKSVEQNLQLINQLDQLAATSCPILLGASRKSFIGKILNIETDQRLEGTIAAHVAGILRGAKILRVHDVREARRSADMAAAILNS